MPENPKVFISYSHKDPQYEDQVLAFANKLRSEGIDASIDQYEKAPVEGWPRWMELQIIEAQYVIVLCDETYYGKLYSTNKGKGVVWEARIVYQMLYDASAETTKFIPAFFDADNKQFIPTPLKSFTYYDLSKDADYDKLYWRLRGVTKTKKPPLGELKPVPEKKRKTMFYTSPIVVEKWDRAKWRGIVYLLGGDAPAIGLFFQNYVAGKEIFYDWKTRYSGLTTADEFIKVDYIVPPFPSDCWIYKEHDHNFGKGYFLHIGANVDAAMDRAKNGGLQADDMLLATFSRYQWMDEIKNSDNRDNFFDMLNQTGKYYLVPVGLKSPSVAPTPENIVFDFDCAIPMKTITVTEGRKLKDNDPCKAVITKPEGI